MDKDEEQKEVGGGHILTPYLQPEMIKECGAYALPSQLPCV